MSYNLPVNYRISGIRIAKLKKHPPQDVVAAIKDKEKSMRHFGLAPVTLLTVAFTAFLLPASGWFSSRESARPTSRIAEARTSARDHDLSSDAVWRHRTGQPNHWRALVMHR